MNKEAIAAKTLLKSPLLRSLAAGTAAVGLAGGSGYLGHKAGFRSGANETANEMASAFSEANEIENRNISSDYMRRGIVLGAHLHAAGKIRIPKETTKTSSVKGDDMNKQAYLEEIYNESFNDELEKSAVSLRPVIDTIKKSFGNLGSGSKAVKDALTMKGANGGMKTNIKRAITEGGITARNSKAALGIIGGGALASGAGGYALGRK